MEVSQEPRRGGWAGARAAAVRVGTQVCGARFTGRIFQMQTEVRDEADVRLGVCRYEEASKFLKQVQVVIWSVL